MIIKRFFFKSFYYLQRYGLKTNFKMLLTEGFCLRGAHGTQHAACGMRHAACGAQTLAASQSSAFSYSLFCLLLLNAAHTALAGVVCSQSGSRVAGGYHVL
jgi:hypothetical protein